MLRTNTWWNPPGKVCRYAVIANGLIKGVYPQSDVSLAMIDIDASKGFFTLWVHLSFAIFAIFDLKGQLKLLEMAFEQSSNMLNISRSMGTFSYKK